MGTKQAWALLAKHWRIRQQCTIGALFVADGGRFDKFSLRLNDLLLDFSKTTLENESVRLLLQLAVAAKVEARRDAMLAGDIVNGSEGRAALHTALRADGGKISINGEAVLPEIRQQRLAMLTYAEQCRGADITATNGDAYTDVVNIGIGGSDLGPAMATAALAPYHDGPRLHFVSNMDGAHLADTLSGLDAKRTLLIVSSKTFTTMETLTNAVAARQWLSAALGEDNARLHIVAVTAKTEKATDFGVSQVFPHWEWVGGRYSLWGATGLPLALAIGASRFEQFLAGARAMDAHFAFAPAAQNLPLMLGLIGVWHRNICGYPTRAVLPYSQRLNLLPMYLQQLDMESNGKNILQDGQPTPTDTAPIIWGGVGSNAQHAYFQMLHQGTDIVPCEFIAAARCHERNDEQHKLLLANCLAQSAALAFGGNSADKPSHSQFAGNRPSVTILYEQLTPYTLGGLIALCEHRTFVEGTIWGVNSFDQWGVELGKTMAKSLFAAWDNDDGGEDSSTRGLLRHIRRLS